MRYFIFITILCFGLFGYTTAQQPMFNGLNYDEVVDAAKASKQPYFIDFTADWCLPCKLMDETVFRDWDVVSFAHNNFKVAQLDIEDFDAMILKSKYQVTSLPTILIFDYKGNLIGRVEGLQTGTNFLKILKEYHAKAIGA